MTFLNMIASLSTHFASLILKDNEEKLEYKNITELFEEFDSIKNTYLDKPLELLAKQVSDIASNNETILKMSNKIAESCKKITDSYLTQITEKLSKFEVKITKQYKKIK